MRHYIAQGIGWGLGLMIVGGVIGVLMALGSLILGYALNGYL